MKGRITIDHINITAKRLILYISGLFFLSLGVSFSIQANLGVSPVSSLAYAFTLSAGISIGLMTIAANILFITLQIILSKKFNLREAIVQLMITFLFGFMMDFTLFLVQILPAPETWIMRSAFLVISLFVVSTGLLGYFSAKFPLMPYDELTHVISEKFNMQFSKAKITSDLLNVAAAGLICIIFIQSLGSIGIGTLIAAYFIGKITGWMMKEYQHHLIDWSGQRKAIAEEVIETAEPGNDTEFEEELPEPFENPTAP
ncbi:hypothetical protein GCM10007275_19030 [Jeotgalicoccus coquinae]|uniref:Membrane protein YczE n=1 Tax=Jeotgalicoccus coquinae TaxID=709509 RepID=A0A6V7RPZ9_9STAP|nr:putative membrane protein YczE [Jeotgalicoccus coquinae]GGE24137.1 hypothetical protein GCM10007275_19030 [Jeotgalicoccus coquinae]CAD2080556.1 hypothetical protein JEOCOQ751_01770 [Jeotgalicoccus coquinae]